MKERLGFMKDVFRSVTGVSRSILDEPAKLAPSRAAGRLALVAFCGGVERGGPEHEGDRVDRVFFLELRAGRRASRAGSAWRRAARCALPWRPCTQRRRNGRRWRETVARPRRRGHVVHPPVRGTAPRGRQGRAIPHRRTSRGRRRSSRRRHVPAVLRGHHTRWHPALRWVRLALLVMRVGQRRSAAIRVRSGRTTAADWRGLERVVLLCERGRTVPHVVLEGRGHHPVHPVPIGRHRPWSWARSWTAVHVHRPGHVLGRRPALLHRDGGHGWARAVLGL